MRKTLAFFALTLLLGWSASIAPALAQNANGTPGSTINPSPQQTLPDPGPDAPSPVTGELVPLPTAPPEGGAATIKLPNCAPPNCGVPQIMTQ